MDDENSLEVSELLRRDEKAIAYYKKYKPDATDTDAMKYFAENIFILDDDSELMNYLPAYFEDTFPFIYDDEDEF